MSEDGFSDSYDEPSMDLFIETLTGTTFEMRVYPSDTILDIKKKIQRVEGIPVHHQNLLFRMEVVEDYKCLCDVGIVSGSTLKLVLSMRGGPISTKRLSTCDHHLIWKDLKDLIEHTREQFGGKLSAGAKVSVLVFKDGDIINLVRVIENGDGSYHPYSNKSPTSSTKLDCQENRPLGVYNKLQENNSMLSKITELRKKMSDVSLKRHFKNSKPVEAEENVAVGCIGEKPLKENEDDSDEAKEKLHSEFGLRYRLLHQFRKDAESLLKLHESQFGDDEVDDENDSDDFDEVLQMCEDSIALKEKHRGKNSFYNILFQDPSLRPEKSAKSGKSKYFGEPSVSSTFTKSARERTAVETKFKDKTSDTQSGFSNSNNKPHPDSISEKKFIDTSILSPMYNRFGTTNHNRTHKYESKISLPDISCDLDISPPTTASSIAESIAIIDEDTENEDKELLSPIGVPFAGTISMSKVPARNSVRLTPLLLQNSDRPKSSPETVNLEENAQEICDIFSGGDSSESFSTKKLGLLKRWQSVDCSSDEICNSNTSRSGASIKDNRESSNYEVVDHSCYIPSLFSTSPGTTPKNDRISDLYFGNRLDSEKMSRSPLYRRYSQIGNSYEKGAFNSSSRFSDNYRGKLPSLASTWGPLNIESRPKPDEATSNCDNLLNIQPLTGTLYNIISGKNSVESDFVDNHMELNPLRIRSEDESKLLADEIKNLGEYKTINKIEVEATKLESLPAIITKKRIRCAECNKRLNITNMYHCRCGGIFCGQHRYSEVHHCNYDYKSEGRKIIEQQNPVIVADKLNKL
ncbi:hypothetical protein RN001_012957 [Aquatica leii]|uniref:AN1-type zinc finger protein 4 n=1 Tax=Aquatica leii TaxID=1421715 RepID=A0AAN7NZA8_9COLE|nr:hypothetical protein RN001_012957 [Aquatica leii]